ncbi:MAG: helix-turn-helix domain-containing protein [Pseudomonadota bacterium]
MTSLPIPMVVALMLVILAAGNHHALKETATGRLFLAVLYSYAGSMCLIGLRWSLDQVWLMKFAATLAVISTVLLYLAFQSLGRRPALSMALDRIHLLPVMAIVLTAAFSPHWTDPVLVIIKTIYAVLLIRRARNTPVSLQLTRLDWLKNTEGALWWAALLILASVVIDIAIAADFAFNNGRFAASIVGVVNLLSVFIIGWVSVQAGKGSVAAESADSISANVSAQPQDEATHDTPTAEDDQLLQTLKNLLIEQQLFADANLNLQKLARKAGHPPRKISQVVNRVTGQNFSQWVNTTRIEAVCLQLKHADVSITQAMHDAGFSTKSNFNREFKRITGLSPSAWRAQHAPE